MARIKLITKEIRKQLPAIRSTADKKPEEVKVQLKIFDPTSRFTFYATEFDGTDTLFGFCRSALGSDCDELGYASVSEIEATRGRFGVYMERDLFWNRDTTLAQVMSGEKR